MEYWITRKRKSLLKTLKMVDALIINEAEVRELSGEANLIRASRKVFAMGPRYLIVKRGEYGAVLFRKDSIFFVPGFPLEEVFDPTGAGDLAPTRMTCLSFANASRAVSTTYGTRSTGALPRRAPCVAHGLECIASRRLHGKFDGQPGDHLHTGPVR
jgi:sugar/nucleoside kinase (ribokinase family)